MSTVNFGSKNCIAIRLALAVAGFPVAWDGHAFSCADSQADDVRQFIDGFTVEAAARARIAEIEAVASGLFCRLDAANSKYAPTERVRWPELLAEVARYDAGDSGACPRLQGEAVARGVGLDEMVAIVRAKNAAYTDVADAIVQWRGRHAAALLRVPDFGLIDSYDYRADIPVVA